MKRTMMYLSLLLVGFFLFACATQEALPTKVYSANERIVKFTVPGCAWDHTADRVSVILEETPGVFHVKANILTNEVTVTFDPSKTSNEELMDLLGRKGFPVKGEPRVLK